jgi:hypothetical protein
VFVEEGIYESNANVSKAFDICLPGSAVQEFPLKQQIAFSAIMDHSDQIWLTIANQCNPIGGMALI